jgi:hypothetical protein
MTLANCKFVREIVIRVTKILFVSFQLRTLEANPSVRFFVCTYETTRTPFN